MGPAETPGDFDLVPLGPQHDEAVQAMSREAGLSVDPEGVRHLAHCCALVAVAPGGKPLGFATGWVVAGEAELYDVCVAVEMRRRGIGRALVEGFAQAARGRGAKMVFLEVGSSNGAAQALYKDLGFEVFGRRDEYYSDGQDALLFRCCFHDQE